MSIRDWLDLNYDAVECRALEELGWAAYAAALGSAFTGAWVVTGGAVAVNAAAGAAWALGRCGDEPPGMPDDAPPGEGCQEATGRGMQLFQVMPEKSNQETLAVMGGIYRYPSFSNPSGSGNETSDGIPTYWDYTVPVAPDGETRTGTAVLYSDEFGVLPQLFTELYEPDPDYPDECVDDGPPTPGPDDPVGPDIPGPEDEDGCNWTLTPIDSYVDTSGIFHFKYKVCPDRPECGECFTYWHTQNGPQYHSPDAPDPPPPGADDERNARDCCDETLAKLDQLLAGQREILNNLPEEEFPWADLLLLLAALLDLLNAEPPQYEADTYILKGFCEELNDDGEQPEFSTPILGGTFDVAVLSRLDAMQHLLQAHLGYKTPICTEPKPELKGDWRTISFISDETSPFGKSRLRKRLRYRSESGVELSGLVDHWANFVWEAGPVCVIHKGSSVGTPQVWASSIDEGKRVLRHAFGESGVDPDQVGEWRVSGSDNPRFGVSGTMRVNTDGGYYWITERLGSNNRPQVSTS